jgi:MFS family permease
VFLGSGIVGCSCELNNTKSWCNSVSIYCINIISSFICGFSAAVIWVAASTYISELSENQTKLNLYFGLFTAFTLGSQFFGNLLSLFIL